MSKKYKGIRHPEYKRFVVKKLIERFGNECHICGLPMNLTPDPGTFLPKITQDVTMATIDHLNPTSQTGKNQMDNLRLAHSFCNNLRGCHPVSESLQLNIRQKFTAMLEERENWEQYKSCSVAQ